MIDGDSGGVSIDTSLGDEILREIWLRGESIAVNASIPLRAFFHFSKYPEMDQVSSGAYRCFLFDPIIYFSSNLIIISDFQNG